MKTAQQKQAEKKVPVMIDRRLNNQFRGICTMIGKLPHEEYEAIVTNWINKNKKKTLAILTQE